MRTVGKCIYQGDRTSNESYDSFTVGKIYTYEDEGDDRNEGYFDGLITVTNDEGTRVEAMSIAFDPIKEAV